MDHQRWIKRTLISAAVATSFGLTACGGGGDSAGTGDIATTTTLLGIVADGYLVNATVCLDLNLSKTCDSGEPSATSTSGGNYSLDATQAQIGSSPVVAEIIAGTTVDEDSPSAPVSKAYTLTAPAGKGAFVSPLTTMVQAQVETTGKTVEQVENDILVSMGQDPTLVSLFDDYVAKKTDPANPTAVQGSYLQLHQVAQVTASTIANNIETIVTAINSGDISMDLSTTLDSVITIIVQNVITELTTITNEIDNATTFDADTIATTTVPPLDTTTINDQVAVAESAANSVTISNVEGLFTSGISWLWAKLYDWSGEWELERSSITYNAAIGKLAEPIESYNFTTTPDWTLVQNSNDILVLQTDGTWAVKTDSLEGSSVTFDLTSGPAAVESPWGTENWGNIKTIDLADLNIMQFVSNKLPDLAKRIDPAAVFTTGSKAYSLNITSLEDAYTINCGLSFQNGNGNCNTVVDYSTGSGVVVTSLTDLLSPTAWVDPGGFSSFPRTYTIDIYANLRYELVKGATDTSGPVNYYQDTPEFNKIGTGTWNITTVNGVEILMVDHPDALMSKYLDVAEDMDSPEENHFFAIQDFVVRQGSHWPANIVEDTAESVLTNQKAQDEITSAFLKSTFINATASSQLSCDTDSDWNLFIDKPLVAYSFADYEAVVSTCGGALAVDANTLTDGGVSKTYGYNWFSITFNNDNTGSYSRSIGENITFSFNWTIDSATNYITLVSLDGTSRHILAVVTIDTNMLPNIFKDYIEEFGRSDMITDQGSDGQIIHLAPFSYDSIIRQKLYSK